MSDNKLGGVPTQTRDALYKMFEKMRYGSPKEDDVSWAAAIQRLTELGPKEALARMEKGS